ncbi:MAG: SOS response-associated peptidase, partial [Casimicrobiaceae bacterium]
MCGRYELHTHPAAIALAFDLGHVPDALLPRYNIAPLTEVPVVRVNPHGKREIVHLRWGLVPRWAKDPSLGSKMINARGESLAAKHAYRIAYRRHRCLLPADGFYEWMACGPGERKQPVHIGMQDGHPFGLGGLYERWLSPQGEVLDTCTIVTTEANMLLRPVHDRMPLVIAPADYARWLDSENADVGDLVGPFPAERMTYYPVSTKVNAA